MRVRRATTMGIGGLVLLLLALGPPASADQEAVAAATVPTVVDGGLSVWLEGSFLVFAVADGGAALVRLTIRDAGGNVVSDSGVLDGGVAAVDDRLFPAGESRTYELESWDAQRVPGRRFTGVIRAEETGEELLVDPTYDVTGDYTIAGKLGVGTSAPARAVHLAGSNAVFRMDRSVNSAAFLLVRTNAGGAPLKTFVVGVNASAPNDGQFIINDLGAAVAGGGTRRMTIANNGDVTFGGSVTAAGFSTPGGPIGGLTTVDHDSTLTGDGTSGSPLGLADGAVTLAKLGTTNTPASPTSLTARALAAASVPVLTAADGNLAWSTAGTGDVTAVSAGNNLTGGGTENEVTLGLADDIDVNSVTAWQIDTAILDAVDASIHQAEFRAAAGSLNVRIGANPLAGNHGLVAVTNATGSTRAEIYSQSAGGMGIMRTFGPSGGLNVELSGDPFTLNPDFGGIGLFDGAGTLRAEAWVDAISGAGQFATYGPSDPGNVWLGQQFYNPDFGLLMVMDDSGDPGVLAEVSTPGWTPNSPTGVVTTYGPNHNANTRLTGNIDGLSHGYVAVFDDTGTERVAAFANPSSSAGELSLRGANGSRNIKLDASAANFGYATLYDDNSNARVIANVHSTHKAGRMSTLGPNGSTNVTISYLTNDYSHGWIGIHNSAGTVVSSMSASDDGGVLVTGASKSVSPYPGQEGAHIVYGRPEGPEAGLYVRGRATLKHGRGTITLPDHFTVMADLDTVSVHLTPHSLASRGVGVDRIAGNVILVGELAQGQGSYEVSYLVQAARRGTAYEPVVQDDLEVARRYGIGPPTEIDVEMAAVDAGSEAGPGFPGVPERPRLPERPRGAAHH